MSMYLKMNKTLLVISCILPLIITSNTLAQTKVIYPLQKISALDCRFQKFSELSDACKIDLPILHTSDYKKYLAQDGWYNIFTRVYTVLWWASYKYGWDVWNGGHEWTDIATAEWTPVYAIADGTVISAGNILGRWNEISIQHEINGKTIVSNYAHLSKIEVQQGDKLTVWTEIGQVWSTWNSYGNHLHFQIDLEYKIHPFYYDYNDCPYSYDKITESDICFPILQQHTIDPLLFLETQWDVLNQMDIKTEKIDPTTTTTQQTTNNNSSNSINIFAVTVYRDSPTEYIKMVQKVLRDIGIYKWTLSWDYADVEDDILAYQLSRHIIASASDVWAWYWWPKTRTQVKSEYDGFSSTTMVASNLNKTQETVVRAFSKTVEKIDRSNLLTREEIDLRAITEFLGRYNVSVLTDSIGWSIKVGDTKTLSIVITDRKGKPYKGSLPWELTATLDSTLADVFPKTLYYFTDGKRDITVTARKAGSTTLKINIWQKTIKEIPLSIYGEWIRVVPVGGGFVSDSQTTIWENKTWLFEFKDKTGHALINLKFDWNYRLTSNENVIFCIKKWSIKDIQKIYKETCKKEDYATSHELTYADTVGWILVFDYIINNKSAKITLTDTNTKANLGSKIITTVLPKWLAQSYEYYPSVIAMLQNNIATWISQWYFQQNNPLKERDAQDWIINTLRYMKRNTKDDNLRVKINVNINKLKAETVSDFNAITREDFLKKVYDNLIFNQTKTVTIQYKDLSSDLNQKANAIFDIGTTWKDQFWQTYYRPSKTITRWEATYLLSTVLAKTPWPLVTTAR